MLRVTANRTHLGALRRLWQLSMWCVLLCVQTSQRTLLYVRPDQRHKGWRRCPGCGEVAVGYKDDQGFPAVRDHPLLGQRVYLLVHTRTYHCRNRACAQKTFTARGSLVGPHQRWTERFAAGLEPQIVDMDLKTNAQMLDISYRQIRALEAELIAQAERLAWFEEQVIKEAAALQVGLDERWQHRRHKYVNVLYEKSLKKLLDMCPGRKKEDVAQMLETIPAAIRAKIKTVTIAAVTRCWGPSNRSCRPQRRSQTNSIWCAMWVRSCRRCAIGAEGAKALLGSATAPEGRLQLKRTEAQKIEAQYRKKTKGWTRSEKRKVKRRVNIYSQVRYALLRPRSYWNDPKDDQQKKQKKAQEYAQLQQALTQSPQLNKAYDLFNEFRDLFDNAQLDRAGAHVVLTAWYKKATHSGLRGFKRLVKSLQAWKEYILNYFAYAQRYTNAAVEGLNNKCKRVQRHGYGVSKFAHYKHRCKRAVNGGFVGLGRAAENPADNFIQSPQDTKAHVTGVKSGRGRKKVV